MKTVRPDIALDRASPVPLYFQVSLQLEAAIDRGDLVAGHRLDNEIELADSLGVSRPTMRRAIQELVDKGLLVRKRGVGTQVVHGTLKRRVELSSLFDDLAKSHRNPTTEVLRVERCPPITMSRWPSGWMSAARSSPSNDCAEPTARLWPSCATGCRPIWHRAKKGSALTASTS